MYSEIVLSSTGEAADVQGGILGEYQYDRQKGHYVQSNSEIYHEKYQPKYIYRNNDYEEWHGGPISGDDDNLWLWNANKGLKVPDDSKWDVLDMETDTWSVDPDLKVTEGSLKPCKGAIIYGTEGVAREQGDFLGTYKVTNKRWNGHPVYKSNNGRLLHMSSDGYWSASDRLGEHSIRGKPGRLCPSESDEWEFWDGSKSEPAKIIVKSL